jgi:hypothetical protein
VSYRVSYDQGTGTWAVLSSTVYLTTYTATGLTFGKTYSFRVEALNSYGYSTFSTSLSLLCASKPLQPT